MARSRRQSRCCCAPEKKMSASLRSCSIAKNGHSEKEGKRRECPEAMRDLAMSVSHLERERELNTHRTFLVSPSSVQHFFPLLRFDLIRKQEATAASASVSFSPPLLFCLCCRICISVAAAAAASSLSPSAAKLAVTLIELMFHPCAFKLSYSLHSLQNTLLLSHTLRFEFQLRNKISSHPNVF